MQQKIGFKEKIYLNEHDRAIKERFDYYLDMDGWMNVNSFYFVFSAQLL